MKNKLLPAVAITMLLANIFMGLKSEVAISDTSIDIELTQAEANAEASGIICPDWFGWCPITHSDGPALYW